MTHNIIRRQKHLCAHLRSKLSFIRWSYLPLQIVFKTDIYGTFRQQVVLGFGLDTVVVRDVQVESCPATDPEKLTKDLELSAAGRWTPESVTIVPFLPP